MTMSKVSPSTDFGSNWLSLELVQKTKTSVNGISEELVSLSAQRRCHQDIRSAYQEFWEAAQLILSDLIELELVVRVRVNRIRNGRD